MQLLAEECPPEAIRWAGIGWQLGILDGRDEVHRQIGRAGDDILTGGLPILKSPAWDELVERRGETTPCSTRCDACTRCRISRTYWARKAYGRLLAVGR